ncbi:MAG: P-loop NTPase fold protein [Proteobacteria bacterium]|nr:P-loop NTPase fold protein [Pseudomonadota bacterium]
MFQEKIRLHPDCPIEVPQDEPFKHDVLKLQDSVKNLDNLIQHVETPFTLGIYGAWGSGKTSFMKMLQAKLSSSDSGYRTFWFEAWKYENELTLMLPLLSEMYNELKGQQLKDSLQKIGAVSIISFADLALKLVSRKLMDTKTIVDNFKLYEDEMGEVYKYWKSETAKSVQGFESVVDAFTEGKKGLIVFIDDLDRCLPDLVIKMIEGIKHFFSVKKCIFIIGVDKEVLSKAIKVKYGDLIDGNEYLEKIINLSYELPDQLGENIKDFVIETAKRMTAPEWYKTIQESVLQVADELVILYPKNIPRKIRLIVMRLLIYLALERPKLFDLSAICLMLILKEFFPNFYNANQVEGRLDFYAGDERVSYVTTTFGQEVLNDRCEINKPQYGIFRDRLSSIASEKPHNTGVFRRLCKEVEFLYSLH